MNTQRRLHDLLTSMIVLLLFAYSGALLIHAALTGENLPLWIWDRHQNQFSWYSRPLFVAPACYYAYRRKPGYVVAIMALLFTSLFWFPAPQTVPEHISNYLDWERGLFFNKDSWMPLILLIAMVCIFLCLLFAAFWTRKPWYGLLIVNVGTGFKVAFSLFLDPVSGAASIVPSVAGLGMINGLAFLLWYLSQRRSSRQK